ncbi:MAG: hypothetical protein HS102_02340 [Planctomycetia bacterium]|nr:hypothetical protein [Planctomycetia bacterium]
MVYLLPNDREEFKILPVTPGNVYVIREPSIAKFAVSDTELTSWIPAQEPFTLHGLIEGETELQERVGSPSGPLVCTIPVKVGGTVTLEFDQLPTYTPGTGTLLYVAQDYQLGDLPVPNETKAALEEKGNVAMSYWVIVRDADGHAMYNKVVALVQVPDEEYPDTNLMNIQYDGGDHTADPRGVVKGTVRLQDLGLDIDDSHWKLIVLVGQAAENWHQGELPVQELDDVFQHQFDSSLLDNRVFNGHLIRIKREDFPALGGEVETGMALSLPHVSSNYYGIFRDFFEKYLDRRSVILTNSNQGVLPSGEYWRLNDYESPQGQPLLIESEWWTEPAVRELLLPQRTWLLEEALPEFPQDDISILVEALYAGAGRPSRYFPQFLDPNSDYYPPVGQEEDPVPMLIATFATEVAIGFVPFGDLKDIAEEGFHLYEDDGEFSKLTMGFAVAGFLCDIGSFFGVGVPANGVCAFMKGLIKAGKAKVVGKALTVIGGGVAAFKVFGKYLSRFAKSLAGSDWVKPKKIKDAFVKAARQFFRMSESRIVRISGATDEVAGECTGRAMKILAERGRDLSDTAAEGLAAFHRHGSIGADALDDLVPKMTANLSEAAADDAVEGVGEAITRSYRDKFPVQGDPKDLKALTRVDEAVEAGRRALDSHLRNIVSPHIGPDKAIKSMEEFEVLRHMQANNLKPAEVQALNAIRQAIGLPNVNDDLVKVLDLDTAVGKLTTGDPNLTGFFGKKADLGNVTTTEQLIGAQRLDYDGSPFNSGSPHVILETKMTQSLSGNAKIPRHGGYLDGSSNEFQIPQGSRKYPNTGNGLISSTDGRLRPESYMSTATGMPENVTIMKVRNADGSPRIISANGQSASEWKLVEYEPAKFRWDPIQ